MKSAFPSLSILILFTTTLAGVPTSARTLLEVGFEEPYNQIGLSVRVEESPIIDGVEDLLWEDVPANDIDRILFRLRPDGHYQLLPPSSASISRTQWKSVWNSAGLFFIIQYASGEEAALLGGRQYLQIGLSAAYTRQWGMPWERWDLVIRYPVDDPVGGRYVWVNSAPPEEGMVQEGWQLHGNTLTGELFFPWSVLLRDDLRDEPIIWDPHTATFKSDSLLMNDDFDERSFLGFQLWSGCDNDEDFKQLIETAWSLGPNWSWVEVTDDVCSANWGTLLLGTDQLPRVQSLFQNPSTTRLRDNWAYNQIGYLYDKHYPFVWMDGTKSWWYIHARGWATEINGFYFYDFGQVRWGWVCRDNYAKPIYFD